jgi:hypothetical protein
MLKHAGFSSKIILIVSSVDCFVALLSVTIFLGVQMLLLCEISVATHVVD